MKANHPVVWIVTAMLIGMVPAVVTMNGCAATQKSESTGQYIDDSAITTKVQTAILQDPQLKVGQISVETYKGVVQLSGFVNSAESVKRAGDVAAGVPGVVAVKNNLIVK